MLIKCSTGTYINGVYFLFITWSIYVCNFLCINRYFDKYNSDDAVNSYLHHCIEKFEGMSDVQETGILSMHIWVFMCAYTGIFRIP